MTVLQSVAAAIVLFAGVSAPRPAVAAPSRQMENLGRGVVAVPQGDGKVYVGWRLLGTDADDVAFNVYRVTGDDAPVKLNAEPVTASTNLVDAAAKLDRPTRYVVRPVVGGREQEPGHGAKFALPTGAPARQYLEIPLKPPAGYAPNDASAADLDGDGEYELIVHMTGRGRDNSQDGPTDPPVLQAYKLDGTLLWTINLGRNIREGAHYTQFIAYDLDGDGVAEVACKTADGTTDGKGKVIGDAAADWVGRDGRILRGPEYLTIFDGRTGAALATTDYVPGRGDIGAWGGIGGNGGNDRKGNRVDRFLACAAYLDGERPSLVMCRGYYGRSVLAAWDWRGGKLTSRWVFDTAAPGSGKDGKPNADYAGMGAHAVSVADVDGDGRDEIVYHSMVVDDDGTGLFTTGFRHGDALHVGAFDPGRAGLQVFGVHENEGSRWDATTPAAACFDARTGRTIWRVGDGADAGRGLVADIDPRHPGDEMWGGPSGLRTARGEPIGPAPRSANFAIWWDADPLREILDRTTISKWDWEKGQLVPIFTADGCASNNGIKATLALTADLFGDWREEVVFRTADNKALRVYTTTIPTDRRIVTLMHDPQYRLSVAWQNVGYNQPPHTGFHLGDGMNAPPRPSIRVTPLAAAAVPVAAQTAPAAGRPVEARPIATRPATLPATTRPSPAQPAGRSGLKTTHAFSFGAGPTPPGYVRVAPIDLYSPKAGYGFEAGANVAATDPEAGADPVTRAGSCASDAPFYFSAAVPEGNYRVTVTLGGPAAAVTTVKAELRRLMLEQVSTAPGQVVTRTFVVNVRAPEIAGGGRVRLKAPRETTDEAWAWDERITLEFNGARPSLCALRIERVDVPTVYVLGDSTVCDQSKEPYASWGQMLPRLFKPDVAVANHAESGESLGSSTGAHRLDKVLSLLCPGDFVLVQYGHNDMKSKAPDAVLTYKATLKDWTRKIKARGGTPVLVTPMNRHSFRGGTVTNSLGEYPETVRQVGKEEGAAVIDLNATSKTLYEALGEKESIRLFKHNADLTEFDGTHHSPYGAYELAKCVAEGLRRGVPELGKHLADDVPPFDPAKPDPADKFGVPPSPGVTNRRPLGD